MLNIFKQIKRKRSINKIKNAVEILGTLDQTLKSIGYSRQVLRRMFLAMSKNTNEV